MSGRRREAAEEQADPVSKALVATEAAGRACVATVKSAIEALSEGDAAAAQTEVGQIVRHIGELMALRDGLERAAHELQVRADQQQLLLESGLRDECARREWRVDGQWPTLYIQQGIEVAVGAGGRTVSVAGRRLKGTSVKRVSEALAPLVATLIPPQFDASAFIAELAASYDELAGRGRQVPVYDLYRVFVIRAQRPRFWRNAHAETFIGLTIEQFRARLSLSLERGIVMAPDGRGLRLLPPLNPNDGLFLLQPAEARFGFVGRIEFVTG